MYNGMVCLVLLCLVLVIVFPSVAANALHHLAGKRTLDSELVNDFQHWGKLFECQSLTQGGSCSWSTYSKLNTGIPMCCSGADVCMHFKLGRQFPCRQAKWKCICFGARIE